SEGRLPDGSRLEPFGRHDADPVLILGPIDLAELGDHDRVRPEAREDFDVRALELGGGVEHAINALGIVPAVAEGGVGVLRLAGRFAPWAGAWASAGEPPGRRDAVGAPDPRPARPRGAATRAGLAPWLSPSRRRRAGGRASS